MQLLYHDVLKDTGVGPISLTQFGAQRFRRGARQYKGPIQIAISTDITSLNGPLPGGNSRKLERNGLDKTA